MTIHLNQTFVYYWVISFVYEAISIYFGYKSVRKKIIGHPQFAMVKMYFQQSASLKLTYKLATSPVIWVIGFVLLCIAAPLMLPFTLVSHFKKVIGYKSELEKKADAEQKKYEETQKQSEDFMKGEGCVAPESPDIEYNHN